MPNSWVPLLHAQPLPHSINTPEPSATTTRETIVLVICCASAHCTVASKQFTCLMLCLAVGCRLCTAAAAACPAACQQHQPPQPGTAGCPSWCAALEAAAAVPGLRTPIQTGRSAASALVGTAPAGWGVPGIAGQAHAFRFGKGSAHIQHTQFMSCIPPNT